MPSGDVLMKCLVNQFPQPLLLLDVFLSNPNPNDFLSQSLHCNRQAKSNRTHPVSSSTVRTCNHNLINDNLINDNLQSLHTCPAA